MAKKKKGANPEIHGAVRYMGTVYGPGDEEELQDAIDQADSNDETASIDVEALTESGAISGFKGGGKNEKKLRRQHRNVVAGNALAAIGERKHRVEGDGIVAEMAKVDAEQQEKAIAKAEGQEPEAPAEPEPKKGGKK